ncbi:MAG: homospermidine synthase [Candidatus Accumulibacter meliphilus]|uniref:Homospermidine synthase n=1 Tax=Candidatus Accumulibacter meliphilus TaxID=2211374 RepID=A0A369XRD9_9PROT|nr:MAG: homospermidine synthase [Candidatus Accumulibacter meliphilus]
MQARGKRRLTRVIETVIAVSSDPASTPLPAVLILACGNPSRGDDALGPVLLDRLQVWLDDTGRAAGFELLVDFQLQIENALDVLGRHLVLFIDAGQDTPGPFVFRRAQAGAAASDLASYSTHALSPEAVLMVLPHVVHEAAPPAFVLCVRGERFELGEGLSAAASSHGERAFELLQALCGLAEVDAWMGQLT